MRGRDFSCYFGVRYCEVPVYKQQEVSYTNKERYSIKLHISWLLFLVPYAYFHILQEERVFGQSELLMSLNIYLKKIFYMIAKNVMRNSCYPVSLVYSKTM